MMKRSWKPAVFVTLNLFFVVWLGLIFEMLVRVIRGEDALALLGIFAADIAFLAVGVLLIVLNRYYRVSIAGRVLPFIAILALTSVAILNVTTASLWFGLVAAGALILACTATTVRTLIVNRKRE